MGYCFTGKNGTFEMEHPEDLSYLYLPLANEAGMMSSITPDGHGDSKVSQDRFLLEPAVVESLQESMVSRNFWCDIKGYGPWSVFGYSARQQAMRMTSGKASGNDEREESRMRAGLLWQEVIRSSRPAGIEGTVLSFCPAEGGAAEIMRVTLTNKGERELTFTPTAAVPIFARGADHIRDHRHVTALLNRIRVTEDGVEVTPSMVFDERGHHRNEACFGVYGRSGDGEVPAGMFPTVEAFTGEGRNLLCPAGAEHEYRKGLRAAGAQTAGYEAMGALRFPERTLKPGESCRYLILMSCEREGMEYLSESILEAALEKTKDYWESRKVISCDTGSSGFDNWMEWVSAQPAMRKLFGCSFLPYHDYGRGGRGWRDLWQDCLALLLGNPSAVREELISFFAGVRIDGSNATIIGKNPGEFQADRNNIVRVWMDHGYWPMFTVKLYLDQTGDYEFLLEEAPYFKDRQICRGELQDETDSKDMAPVLLTDEGRVYRGTIFEHLLVQQVTQFFDAGEHGYMRLRGADWNDALDMAQERGESVAFTAAYTGTMNILAGLADKLEQKGRKIEIAGELKSLLQAPESVYGNPRIRREILREYCRSCGKRISGQKMTLSAEAISNVLRNMAGWLQEHIRRNEIVGDGTGYSWFNSYYDNSGKKAEGPHPNGPRMMLTGQVFTVMSRTATDRQVEEIIRSADRYLYDGKAGYRLNTDFGEVKMDLGRMFGFAYGHKENGAVFCHMAVMYAYALYSRGFAREGFKVIESLFKQCMDTKSSRMLPGIPEYFGPDGRGMYPWLTGAASWIVLTVQTQMYGIRGEDGDLLISPGLLLAQFDREGRASIRCGFRGKRIRLTLINSYRKEIGDYELTEVSAAGRRFECAGGVCRIPASFIDECPEGEIRITGILE